MPPRRVRRPLVALIVLVVALAIGYGVRAARAQGAPPPREMPAATVHAPPAPGQLHRMHATHPQTRYSAVRAGDT